MREKPTPASEVTEALIDDIIDFLNKKDAENHIHDVLNAFSNVICDLAFMQKTPKACLERFLESTKDIFEMKEGIEAMEKGFKKKRKKS